MTTRSNASCSGFNTLTLFVYNIHSFFIMKPLFYTFLEILFLPGALAWAQPTPKETIPICSIWSPAWAYTKTTIAILGLQEQFNCNTAFSKKRKPLLNMNVLREPSITFFIFYSTFCSQFTQDYILAAKILLFELSVLYEDTIQKTSI